MANDIESSIRVQQSLTRQAHSPKDLNLILSGSPLPMRIPWGRASRFSTFVTKQWTEKQVVPHPTRKELSSQGFFLTTFSTLKTDKSITFQKSIHIRILSCRVSNYPVTMKKKYEIYV